MSGTAEEARPAPQSSSATAPAPLPLGADDTAPARRGEGAAGRRPASVRSRVEDWTELLRLPALFTVPGDVLAGAAATGARSDTRTLLAIGSSLCLYEAGMALNDWADRDEDAAERPHRPLPSGRIRPAAALTAACGLTATGLALAARAGRPAVAVAVPLAATVWAYDLALKHTPAGPLAMATARGLDLLLGAAATGGDLRPAVPSAALLGTHTLAVTAVSRGETRGGSSLVPLAALATTGLLARLVADRPTRLPAGRRAAAAPDLPGPTTGGAGRRGLPGPTTGGAGRRDAPGPTTGCPGHRDAPGLSAAQATVALTSSRPAAYTATATRGLPGPTFERPGHRDAPGLSAALAQAANTWRGAATGRPGHRDAPGLSAALAQAANTWRGAATGRPGHRDAPGLSAAQVTAAVTASLAAVYAATAARPYFHAALNPSPPLTQRAVGGGIRATIPLQAALTARAGGPATALLIAALAPLGRRFARKVSIT